MEKIKLEKTIEELSKLIEITEEKKQELINKFTKLEDKEVIKELCLISYRMFNSDEEKYTFALNVIRDINPNICPTVEEMKQTLNKMFSNEVEGNMSLEDNHKLVSESLINVTKLLNQYGIDYYIVGALPCFLKLNIPLFRYHDDIDIMINEDDIEKVKEVVEKLGYIFHDDRFPNVERYNEMLENKPPHTVLAQNPGNEFHLGFFTFKREKDNSITMREYSHRLENGEVLIDVLERRSTPLGTQLRYDEVPATYKDTTFKTSTVESIYNLKSYTKRPKDITDMAKFEPFIDQDKLRQISLNKNENITINDIDRPDEISEKIR